MKKMKKIGLSLALVAAVASLAACGHSSKKSAAGKTTEHSAAIITDVGGIDDRSFNQSAWEGLQAWGKDNGLKKGVGGYTYFQSNDDSQYTTNMDEAVSNGFKTVFGIGYNLSTTIEKAATKNTKVNFVIVDSVIDGKKNVVSATFQDNEPSYLAGIAAAYSTKTNHVGFIGGVEGPVLDRFEAGFKQGVIDGAKAQGKTIKIDSEYAASFAAPDKGKALAASMYTNGADIIFSAAGGTGTGVFTEAKELNQARTEDKKVWVIGVDRDQKADGVYKTKDGKESNFTLTSTIKNVGTAVKDLATKAADGKFPGGKHLVYGLKDGGVSLSKGNLSSAAEKAVATAKQALLDKKVTAPEKPSAVKQ